LFPQLPPPQSTHLELQLAQLPAAVAELLTPEPEGHAVATDYEGTPAEVIPVIENNMPPLSKETHQT